MRRIQKRNSCSLSERCPSYEKPVEKNICGTALVVGTGLQGCPLLQYFPTLHLDDVSSLKSSFTCVNFTTHIQLGHGVRAVGGFHAIGTRSPPHLCPFTPTPELIWGLVLAASSQTPFSSPNPLSTSSLPPRLFIPARIMFPLHLVPNFPRCCGCQQGSWGCNTGFLSHPLGVTSLIKDRSCLKAQMSWFQPRYFSDIPTRVPSVLVEEPPKYQRGCEH